MPHRISVIPHELKALMFAFKTGTAQYVKVKLTICNNILNLMLYLAQHSTANSCDKSRDTRK
jgi:hypothetical protein